jgi:hypothetical protein
MPHTAIRLVPTPIDVMLIELEDAGCGADILSLLLFYYLWLFTCQWK